jgi:polyhydroxybutyrate depolymerase
VPTAAGTYSLKLDVGGLAPRDYRLHLPPSRAWQGWHTDGKPVRRLPLVIALHGGLSTAAAFEDLTGFDSVADAKGAIVAYPEGWLTSWNAGDCCAAAKWSNTDDVGFLTKLIDKLTGTGLVDPDRVYATGFSNGAGMAYRLACESAGRLAAIGVVEGALVTDCRPDRKVSVIIFHGTADPAVPYNGGGTRNAPTDDRPFPPVSFAVDFWRKANGLATPTAARATWLNDRADSTTGCASTGRGGQGAEVVLCTVKGGGHAWSGTDLQWDFFAAHSRAGA